MAVNVSPRSRPTRISSRSSSDSRAGDGFHAVGLGGRGCRRSVFVTACREQPSIRPISRSLCPFAASRLTSRSTSGSNLFIHASS